MKTLTYSAIMCLILVTGIVNAVPIEVEEVEEVDEPQEELPEELLQDLRVGLACRTERRDVRVIVKVDTIEEVCEQKEIEEEVCTEKLTKPSDECIAFQNRECKIFEREECDPEPKCAPLEREEEYLETECMEKHTKACIGVWKYDDNGDQYWFNDPNSCTELVEDECNDVLKTRTVLEPLTDCTDCKIVKEEKCGCTTKTVTKCESKTQPKCEELTRDVPKQVTIDECIVKHNKTCVENWITDENGDQVYVEDPNDCTVLTYDDCKPVVKTKTVSEPFTDCSGTEEIEECNDVEEETCLPPEDPCMEPEPYEYCEKVWITKEECRPEHKRTPTVQVQSKPFQICDL